MSILKRYASVQTKVSINRTKIETIQSGTKRTLTLLPNYNRGQNICRLFHVSVVVMISKLQLISFFTVLIIPTKDQVSLNTIRKINRNIFDKNDLQSTETLLYGESSLDNKSDTLILNATIYFFVKKRIKVSLMGIEYACFVHFS